MRPLATSEKEWAVALANKVLDTPSRDPDDDLSTMSRQFLRGQESIASLGEEITRLRTTIEAQSVTLQDSSAALAVVVARVKVLEEALKPFADHGEVGDADGNNIADGLMHDRICDWFGLSDFEKARAALNASAGESE